MAHPPSGAASGPATSDLLCRQLLLASGLISDLEVEAIGHWWQRQARDGEPLVAFLTREGVFHRWVVDEYRLLERGLPGGSSPASHFTPQGAQRLREVLAAHRTTSSASSKDTIHGPSGSSEHIGNETLTRLSVTDTHLLRPSSPSGDSISATSEIRPGLLLGHYQLKRTVGRGPKAIVFEADDPPLNRIVSIKILLPELAARGTAWPERFLQEARSTAPIQHPSIVGVFGVGKERGLVFSIRPWQVGPSLEDQIGSGKPLPPIEAFRIARHCAIALSHAHAAGVGHNNLKASNVFAPPGGEVRVADFAGTPFDPREDLRQLGLLVQGMITGQFVNEILRAPVGGEAGRLVAALLGIPGYGFGLDSATAAADALGVLEASLGGNKSASGVRRLVDVPLPASPEVPRKNVGVGQVLGKCLLTHRIGQGSTGVVFRARHQTLNVPVAVKILRAPADGHLERPLKVEARLLAQINHPHIVRVWDFEDDPVLPYLVLEYVEGMNLSDWIESNGRMDPAQAVQVVGQIADGLAAAYRLGIVHRDVKPGNILLTRDGTGKLADLGLAVYADLQGTTRHALAGTAAYMPPEQAGGAFAIDHRADIYSLGVTFYHLVVGRLPYQGGTRMEVILKHSRETPVPPHEIAPHISRAMSETILKMMAKSPADRFASYDELLGALYRLHVPGQLGSIDDAAVARIRQQKSGLFRASRSHESQGGGP